MQVRTQANLDVEFRVYTTDTCRQSGIRLGLVSGCHWDFIQSFGGRNIRVIPIHLERLASAVVRHGSGWDFGHAPAGACSLAQFISAGCYPPP